MSTTPSQLLALALSKVGYAYSQGPTRTTGVDGYFDCSGFTFFLLEHLGIRPPDWQPQSHLQALYCRDHGLLQTIDQAIATPGALLFEGPMHAYVGGAGIPGHVAVSLGNGHTVEAMGHAWGTCIGGAFGRGWSNAGLFPNIDYSGKLVTPAHPDPVTGPQLVGELMAMVIPSRAKFDNGRAPYFVLDMQSDKIVAYNGARLVWRMAGKQPTPVKFNDAMVYPIPTATPHIGLQEIQGGLCVTSGDGSCAFADMQLP